MITPFFPNRQFSQVCWVVPDLKAAAEEWTRTTGVGPWFWFETVTFNEALYRGKPADFPNVCCAIAQAGDVQIELVSHKDDRPTFFSDVVPNGQAGFHDIAFYCPHYDDDLASFTSDGIEVAFSASRLGIRTCWVDTTARLGFMIQLQEASPTMDNAFNQFKEAARTWDGAELFRKLS
jgi:hypothetical protein